MGVWHEDSTMQDNVLFSLWEGHPFASAMLMYPTPCDRTLASGEIRYCHSADFTPLLCGTQRLMEPATRIASLSSLCALAACRGTSRPLCGGPRTPNRLPARPLVRRPSVPLTVLKRNRNTQLLPAICYPCSSPPRLPCCKNQSEKANSNHLRTTEIRPTQVAFDNHGPALRVRASEHRFVDRSFGMPSDFGLMLTHRLWHSANRRRLLARESRARRTQVGSQAPKAEKWGRTRSQGNTVIRGNLPVTS